MPTNSFLTYCSLPLLYSLHDKFPTAVEKRWDSFPNRYTDDNIDIIYDTKWERVPPANPSNLREESGVLYYNVSFLRPSTLPPSERYHYLGEKIRWTEKVKEMMIYHHRHDFTNDPKRYVFYSTRGHRWYCNWSDIPEYNN
jgi:hypothetical protein